MGGERVLRILGIDPGSLVVGYGCLEITPRGRRLVGPAPPLALAAGNVLGAAAGPGAVRVVDAGVLRLGGRARPVAERLLALRQQLDAVLARLTVDVMAIEEAFYGKSASAALRIGEARGVILAGARERGVQVAEFAPARIKRAVAGHGRADKEAVAVMLGRQLGLSPLPKPRDVTDALAAAYCWVQEQATLGGLVAGARSVGRGRRRRSWPTPLDPD